jgi:ribosomal 50S subunit-recycling heat shock protein
MRVDKFLKTSRLVKRRTLAKEICQQGRVKLNHSPCKASATVSIGDLLSIQYGHKVVTVRVEKLLESATKEQASQCYQIVKEEDIV